MSTDLYWLAAPKDQPPPEILDSSLKRCLARRLWGHDGSLRGDRAEVSESLLPYLEGLVDGNVDGAAELADAIREHGAVLLWIE